MAFNPNEHMMKLQNKDYLEVKWRMVWFRDQCPQGTIDTEELAYELDREVEAEVFVYNQEKKRSEKVLKRARGYARYRAIVTDGHGGRATGTKSENAAAFADFGEKAETGAIGRALAALGYGTQFTGDELDEGKRIVDSPVDRSSNGHKDGNASTGKPSEQQLASIRKLCEHLGKPEPSAEDVDGMTYLRAKEVIAELSQEYRQMREKNPQADKSDPIQKALEGHKSRAFFLGVISSDEQWVPWLAKQGIKEVKTGADLAKVNTALVAVESRKKAS